jgi:hypothetical protein
VGLNQTAVGSTLVVLKALNVVQLQNKRDWRGSWKEGRGLGDVWKRTGSLAFLFFFLK